MCNSGRGGASSGSSSQQQQRSKNVYGRKKGHRERWVRAAARSTARTQGIHTSSEEQQHKHGTAQASEQGAEGGGGVLTLLPIDVTDAGMAMLVRPVLENAS